jgi:oligoribonuclease
MATAVTGERRRPYPEAVAKDKTNLAWIDLEMTGLDPDQHVIIEVASLVTDRELNILAEGPLLAIHRSEDELSRMNDWNVRTHTASGLLDRIRASDIDVAEAERQTLEFLRKWVPKGRSPLCGNSIAQDRRFLRREMPELEAFFHYRHVDVSTVKELVRRWYPTSYQPPPKREAHRALDDVRESVGELRWYRSQVFRRPPPPEHRHVLRLASELGVAGVADGEAANGALPVDRLAAELGVSPAHVARVLRGSAPAVTARGRWRTWEDFEREVRAAAKAAARKRSAKRARRAAGAPTGSGT